MQVNSACHSPYMPLLSFLPLHRVHLRAGQRPIPAAWRAESRLKVQGMAPYIDVFSGPDFSLIASHASFLIRPFPGPCIAPGSIMIGRGSRGTRRMILIARECGEHEYCTPTTPWRCLATQQLLAQIRLGERPEDYIRDAVGRICTPWPVCTCSCAACYVVGLC
jgi:hypothetical protein